MSSLIVRPAQDADLPKMIETLADGFLEGAFGDWLVPDLTERRRVFAAYFRIFATDCLERGNALVTGDVSGVSLWWDVDGGHDSGPADYEARLEEACGPYTRRFKMISYAFGNAHPVVEHAYLGFIAVRPQDQGRGAGSLMLDAVLADLDGGKRAAYLEASNARNRKLYERHGFHPGPVQYLPEDGPPWWPCWRPTPQQ